MVLFVLISSGFIYAVGFAITHFSFRFKNTFFASPLWPKTSLNLVQQQKSRKKLLQRYFIWSESQAQSSLAAQARLTPTCTGLSFSCFQTDHFCSNSFSLFFFIFTFIYLSLLPAPRTTRWKNYVQSSPIVLRLSSNSYLKSKEAHNLAANCKYCNSKTFV